VLNATAQSATLILINILLVDL